MKTISWLLGAALCGGLAAAASADPFDTSAADLLAQARSAAAQNGQAPAAEADSGCAPMRMDGPGGSMEHVAVRDQGPYGTCYAQAAVQMADAYRFSHGDSDFGRQTAAQSAAIGWAEETKAQRDPFEGGESCDVIDSLRENGGHDAFSVGRCMYGGEVDDAAAMKRLEDLYDSYQDELAVIPSSTTKAGTLAVAAAPAVAALRGRYVTLLEHNEPWVEALQPRLTRHVLADFFDYPRDRFIWALSTYRCFGVDKPQPLNFLPACVLKEHRIPGPGEESRAVIDARLAMPNPQPVEIDYCAEVLHDPNYAGVDRSPNSQTQCLGHARWAGGHASLIIGRRMGPDNKCQYLIRNSWGVDVPGKKEHVLPGAEPTEIHKHGTYSPRWELDHGDVWVDADSLTRSLMGVSYLDDGSSASTTASN